MAAPAGIHNYIYNNIYELTSVTGSQTHNYAYDNLSNRTTADSVVYTKNNLNQYTHVGSTSFSYDSNGNLTNDGNHTYTYDVENRLTSSLYPLTSSYQYDGFGRRISKTVSGITTYFIYDGDQIIEERDSTGALKASYVYGNGIDEILTRSTTDDGRPTYYYFMDGLGSISDLANTNGELIESYTYDAYGTPSAPSAVGNPFMFTGREYDSESGLYHYRARAYSPTIGRFLQRDPIGYYDSMNLFEYARNNPINLLDPHGLSWKDWDPNYGDWGGNDRSGGTRICKGALGNPDVPATDSLDEQYKKHDQESYARNPNADKNLLSRLTHLNSNPAKWPHPPKNKTKAEVHRNLAYAYFWWVEFFKKNNRRK